jgi:cell division protein FtsL
MPVEESEKPNRFRVELKDVVLIGGLIVSVTMAYANVKYETSDLDERVDKLEKLELNQLSRRVDRLSCRISQLLRQLKNEPTQDCPD